jgi:arginine utilization protein RocB
MLFIIFARLSRRCRRKRRREADAEVRSMQPKEINILSIMKDLVSVQSDTGTRQEERAAEKIAEYFESDAYFAAHPDHWGLCDTGDFLGRRVVWALKEGKSRKVLVLTGHYDAVETDCYGELKPLALDPDALREEMLRRKLGDERLQQELAGGCPDAQRPT